MMRPRILLGDPHPLFRGGLAALLQAQGFQIVGQVCDAPALLETAWLRTPEIVLMDARLPGAQPLGVARELIALLPEVRVIFMAERPGRAEIVEAIRAGVKGFILKDTEPGVFIELMQLAAQGGTPLSPSLAGALFDELAEHASRDMAPRAAAEYDLCPREREILGLICQGLDNRSIAARLSLSENTVKYHLKNLFSKWHLHTRTQAVALALQSGMVEHN